MAVWTVARSAPADNAIEISVNPVFTWLKTDNGDPEPRIRFVLSKAAALTSPIVDIYFPTEEIFTLDSFSLDNNTDYYWAVMVEGGTLPTAWKFTTKKSPPTPNVPVDGAVDVIVLPTCEWSQTDGSTVFDLQLSENPDFSGVEGVDLWTYSSISAESKLLTTSLPLSTKIYWRVRGTDGTTPGNWSTGGESFTTSYGTPSTPILTSPEDTEIDVSLNELFTWIDGGSGATSFDIYFDTGSSFSDPVIINVTDTEYRATPGILNNSTTYYWKIVSKNNTGTATSATRSFTVIAPSIPSKPILTSPTGTIDTNVPTIFWSASNDTTAYHVQISTLSDFSSIVEEDINVEQTFYALTSELLFSTTYYIRVRGKNNDVGGSWSDTISFTTVDSTTGVSPGLPSWVYPLSGSINIPVLFTFDWTDTLNTVSWDLEVIDQDNNIIIGTSILLASGSEFTIPTAQALNYGETYTAKVRSVNSWGVSSWVVTTFTTINTLEETAPEIVYPTNGDVDIPQQFTLLWSFAFDYEPGVTYDVQLSNSPDFNTLYVDETNIIPLQLFITLPGTSWQYWVRVRAAHVGGVTEWSTVHQFSVANTTLPGKPVITHPINNATDVDIPTFIDWVGDSSNTEWYLIEIATATTFAPDEVVFREKEIELMSITVSGLLYETEYYVRVRGFNLLADGGYGSWSDTIHFTTNGDTLPGIVQLINPANHKTNVGTITAFSWSSANYADSYTLEVFNSTDFDNPSSRVYLKSGITLLTQTLPSASELDKNTVYFWRVRAKNHIGYGDWMYFTFTTETIDTPAKPVLLLPENYSGEESILPIFSWKEVVKTTAIKYLLEISSDKDFVNIIYESGFILNRILDYELRSDNSPPTNNELEYYSRYFWRVRGVNENDGRGGWSDYFQFVIMDVPAPLRPKITTPSNDDVVNKISNIVFVKGLYTDSSIVEIATDISFEKPVINEETTLETLSVNLDYGRTYYLRVHGVGRGGFGEYSEEIKFKIQDTP